MLHEPAVSISDFALGALSAWLAAILLSVGTKMHRVRKWFVVQLGAVAVAALLGGIVHGFLPDTDSVLGALAWRTTLIAVGAGGVSAIMISAFILFRPGTLERVRMAALILFAIYSGLVLFHWQGFGVAVAFYVPATVLLFLAFLVRWQRGREPFAATGLVSMILTFVAAGLQQFRIDINPRYFDHNVIYHVVQGLAVYVLYRAATLWLMDSPATLQVVGLEPSHRELKPHSLSGR